MSETTLLPLIEAIALTLAHAVWQAGAIALLLAAALRLLRSRPAEWRYAAATAALLAVAIVAGVTFTIALGEKAPGGVTAGEAGLLSQENEETFVTPDIVRSVFSAAVPASSDLTLSRLLEEIAPAVVGLWFAGVFLFSLRLTIGYARVVQLVHSAEKGIESDWSRAMERIRRRIDLRAPVRLLHSGRVEVPTVIGWIRPVILVPLAALSGLDPRQIETILAHEIAHIRRHDYLVNLFQSAVEAAFFYHPAVWWMSRQVRIEREHCCDDLAIALCGDRLLYARALTELEELRALGSPTLAATGGSLLSRIRRIAGSDDARHLHPGLLIAIGATSLLAVAAIAAPMNFDERGSRPGASVFWPSDSPVAHVAAAIAASTPLARIHTAEPVWTLSVEEGVLGGIEDGVIDGHEGGVREGIHHGVLGAHESFEFWTAEAPIPAEDCDDPSAFAVMVATEPMESHSVKVHTARASELARGYGYAFRSNRPVLAAMAFEAQGETVTVREKRAGKRSNRESKELSVEELIALRSSGVDAEYIRAMKATGYDLSLSELASLRSVGVTPDWIASLRAAGYADLESEELQSLRAVGVTREYIDELGRLGIRNLDTGELMTLRAVGVDPAYIANMRALFGNDLGADELTQMKAVGVTAAFAASMKQAGYDDLDPETLVELRAVGVTPDYIRALEGAGYASASLDEIVAARAVGVSVEYLDQMALHGIRSLDLDEVIGLRSVGVTPEWIRQMSDAGYPDLDADEMQQLRAVGVTREYIDELREAGISRVSVDELIQLRSSGVDGAFILRMKSSDDTRD